MRKLLVPGIAVLALAFCAVLVAQSPQPPGHLDTAGSTYATGTVVSLAGDAIVIRTDNGETRTFLINQATVGVQDYATGSRVKVDFVLDDEGRALAKQILGYSGGQEQPASGYGTPSPAPAETPSELETTEEPAAVEEEPAPAEEEPLAGEPAAEGEELPATASPLALLALLGVGGAGAGFGVRLARKR